MPGSTVQLDLFGGSVVYGPPRTFALGVAPVECSECVELVRDDRGCVVWANDGRAIRHPARIVTPEPHSNDELPWIMFPCHERECDSCDAVINGETVYSCEGCDSCDECCVCIRCSYCGEIADDVCRDCTECQSCCSCNSCESCGDRAETLCPRCEWCEGCCEGCTAELDDVEVDLTYAAGLPTDGRTFGVELECVGIGPDTAGAALAAAGLECAGYVGYRHDLCHVWKVVSDSSIRGGGCEVVSPILSGADGLHQLEVATAALRINGATVNESCGTHVHHGMPDATGAELARVVKFYDGSHSAIDRLHTRSRRGAAEWSGPHRGSHELGYVESLETSDNASHVARSFPRFRSVNVTAFPKYGTVEFRQHAGTLNHEKLSAWIEFGQTLIAAALAGASATEDLSTLLSIMQDHGLSDDTASFLNQRALILSAA